MMERTRGHWDWGRGCSQGVGHLLEHDVWDLHVLHGDELLQILQAVHILDLVDELDAGRERRPGDCPRARRNHGRQGHTHIQSQDARATWLRAPSPPSTSLHPLPPVGGDGAEPGVSPRKRRRVLSHASDLGPR